MPLTLRTPEGDPIISYGALADKQREALAADRFLGHWPYKGDGRLLVIRLYRMQATADEAKSLGYLGLPAPPADP